MGDNYQILTPILLVISIGLIAYSVYVMTLVFIGVTLRPIEYVIMISAVISILVMFIIITKEGARLQEKLNKVLRKGNLHEEETIDHKMYHYIMDELKGIIKASKKVEPKETPKEEIKVTEKPKEKAELPEKEPEEERKKIAKPQEEIPKTIRERLEEISRLLREGAKLKDTDIEGSKKAFLRIREIYNSLSPKERKLIDREIAKAMSSRKKTAKKSPKEKK
jgi:hypothetical protein